jgi:hypothetical protein
LEIKVTPPNELEDKYEMRPVVRCSDPIASAERFLDEVLADPSYYNSNAGLFRGRSFTQFKDFVNGNPTTVIAALAKVSPTLDNNLQNRFVDILSAKWGVVSLTDSPIVVSMWKDYADGHKGLVVEFDEASHLFVNYSCVKCDYCDAPVVYDRFLEVTHESMKQIVRRKKTRYVYENETRLIIPLSECRKTRNGTSTLNLFHLDASALVSVTFGQLTPDSTKGEVLEAVTRRELLHVTKWQIEAGATPDDLKRTQLTD